KVVIPYAPGHFSALGMLMADLRRDYVQTLFARLDDLKMDELEAQFKKLETEGRQALENSGIATDQIVFERAADMRYVGQEHAVAVSMLTNRGQEPAHKKINPLFNEAHKFPYSHSPPKEPAERVILGVPPTGRLNKPQFAKIPTGDAAPSAAARRG